MSIDECKIDVNDNEGIAPNSDPIDGPNICCICLDAMNECIYVYVVCNHKIHQDCYKIYSGLHKATTCPMCRTKDVENEDEVSSVSSIPMVYILNTMNRRSTSVHPEGLVVRQPDCRKCIIATSITLTWAWILLMITLFAVKPL